MTKKEILLRCRRLNEVSLALIWKADAILAVNNSSRFFGRADELTKQCWDNIDDIDRQLAELK